MLARDWRAALTGRLVGALLWLACSGAAAAQSPVGGAPGAGLERGCNWTLIFDPARRGLGNTAFPDTAVRYWVAVVAADPPAGSRLSISGRFPAARYAALHVHDGQLGTLDALADYELRPNPGSANPFVDATRRDPGVTFGGRYRARLLLNTPVPAQRAPNTLYRPAPAALDAAGKRRTALVYRTYLAEGDNAGQVRLPALRLVTPQGVLPLQGPNDAAACREIAVDLRRQGANLGSSLIAIDPLPASTRPVFKRYSGILGFESLGTGVAFNQHNGFLFAKTRRDLGQLLLVRGRAPSHTDQPLSPSAPQVRYWSLCHSGFDSQKVYRCLADREVPLDDAGHYTLVMTAAALRPASLDAAPGYSWMPWGPEVTAALTHRELLARADFAQSTVSIPSGSDAAAHKDEFMPQLTYCSQAVFDAAAALGPAEAFSRCVASRRLLPAP